jgi:hypothetical protein
MHDRIHHQNWHDVVAEDAQDRDIWASWSILSDMGYIALMQVCTFFGLWPRLGDKIWTNSQVSMMAGRIA